MKQYAPTIGRERERLIGSLDTATKDDVIAEARNLELDDLVVSRIRTIFSPDFDDDYELLSDEEWGVPISSQGRLRYNLQLVPCKLMTNRLGSVRRDDYEGKNIEISEGNVYLLEETLLPVALDEVVLDLSQKGKELKEKKCDKLVRKANRVINSLLQNPHCRSGSASYDGIIAMDLFLMFDPKTYKLQPHLDGFDLAEVNGLEYSSPKYLGSGELDQILKEAGEGMVHLVKEKLMR